MRVYRVGGELAEPQRTIDIVTSAVGSFEEFFGDTYESLLRALYLVVGDASEAEDVAQEAFVRLYERWESVRDRPNPGGYVYRTALNVHRSRVRRLKVAARRGLGRTGPDDFAAADDRDALARALARIPRGQREALVLVEWLGLSDEEAGHVLGIAPVSVRVRRSRARERLRAQMGGEEGG